MTRRPAGSGVRPPSVRRVPPRGRATSRIRPRSNALAGVWSFIKLVLIIGIFGGAAYGGFRYFMKQTGETPPLGADQINRLQPGMTPEQAHAILGDPEGRREGPGSMRETRVDNVERAKHFEYYRRGTLMLVYDKDGRLIEVCVGETSQEYYDRKGGRQRALWQSYPETGFIHQDVLRPGVQN